MAGANKASITVMLKGNDPAVVGVPEIVYELPVGVGVGGFNPGGSPAGAPHENGAVPPAAVRVALYGVPT